MNHESTSRVSKTELMRRDFQRFTLAAVSGLVLGASLKSETALGAEDNRKSLLEEPHVCRGMNTCKGLGKKIDNACAGQGTCANAQAHECATKNSCKGQGGCGSYPGENACNGMGKGPVPLSDKAWKKARKHFEEQMTKANKKFGPAPPKDSGKK